MGTHIVLLVRHGQYVRTPGAGGTADGGLTPTGIAQAERTATRLRDLPIGHLYASPLRRATETAAIIGRAFPQLAVTLAPLLRECIPTLPAAADQSAAARRAFAGVPATTAAAGHAQAQRAYATYLCATRGPDRCDVLVSSANLIRYLVCRVLGTPEETWFRLELQHAALTEIWVRSRQRLLVRHNDVGHLPRHLQTSS